MYKEIEVCIIDVDGTLTDGVYNISDTGTITKSFYTRDFYAIEQLLRAGLQVIIITQSNDDVIFQQFKRIYHYSNFWLEMAEKGKLLLWDSIDNKVHEIENMFRSGVLGWDNIAYIGDAENDADCIKYAGFSGCPTDAVPYVREMAMYPSDFRGGHGAVHDFCMYLLEMKDKEENIENKESENENS